MHRLLVGLLVAASLTGTAPAATASGEAPASARSCAREGSTWVAAWAAAPSGAEDTAAEEDLTLRSQIYPHTDGSRARLHLTNRFGSAPVTLGSVTLGTQVSGPALEPGSLRAVTFGGERTVTIPAGEDVVSDPVPLRVVAFRTLLSSVYVESAPAAPTKHHFALSTSWGNLPGAGDATGNADGSAFPVVTPAPGTAESQAISYVSGLDVETARRQQGVVAFGDSLTDGFQSVSATATPSREPLDRNGRYPDFLARRAQRADVPVSVVNAGISGNLLLGGATPLVYGPGGLVRFRQDVLGHAGVRTVVVQLGINDLAQGATKRQLVRGFTRLVRMAHRADVRVLLATLAPQNGAVSPGYGRRIDPARRAVNRWIRTQSRADGVVDFDRAVRDPDRTGWLRPEYDGGDHVHLNRAGYRALARAVRLDDLVAPACG